MRKNSNQENLNDIDVQGPIELVPMTDEDRAYFSDLDDKPDRYRWENGKLFEFSEAHKAYLFVAAGNGRSEKKTIADYEEMQLHAD